MFDLPLHIYLIYRMSLDDGYICFIESISFFILKLGATVNLSETVTKQQKALAKQQLEKAIKIDPGYLPAIFLLYSIYKEENAHDKSLAM